MDTDLLRVFLGLGNGPAGKLDFLTGRAVVTKSSRCRKPEKFRLYIGTLEELCGLSSSGVKDPALFGEVALCAELCTLGKWLELARDGSRSIVGIVTIL